MIRRALTTTAAACVGLLACGRGNPEGAVPPHRAVAQVPTDTSLAANQQSALTGDWLLASSPPQQMPGMRMTVTVDSVTRSRVYGRLTHYFAGDVGIDPAEFEAFSDSLPQDGTIELTMPAVDTDYLGITMIGRMAADTIRLETFVLGPDTISYGPRRWFLIKRR